MWVSSLIFPCEILKVINRCHLGEILLFHCTGVSSKDGLHWAQFPCEAEGTKEEKFTTGVFLFIQCSSSDWHCWLQHSGHYLGCCIHPGGPRSGPVPKPPGSFLLLHLRQWAMAQVLGLPALAWPNPGQYRHWGVNQKAISVYLFKSLSNQMEIHFLQKQLCHNKILM